MKTKEWNDFVERYVHSEEMATELKVAFDAEIKKAIAEHEAKLWHKYPEEKPSELLMYVTADKYGKVDVHIFHPYTSNIWDSKVIAFRELPAPYLEGGEG